MASRRSVIGWLVAMSCVAAVSPAPAQQPATAAVADAATETAGSPFSRVPYDEIPAQDRERIRQVIDRPTLATRCPGDVFACNVEQYAWLIDHPDQVSRLWRCLGVKCAMIQDHGTYFAWDDGKGSTMQWHTAFHDATRRIWYAEGKIDPGFLLPSAKVQAVVILHWNEGTDEYGRPAVRQWIELVLHTDSHVLAAAARMIGASAPHLAAQYVGQMQLFYGAMGWYLNAHPQHTPLLLAQLLQPPATDRPLKLPADR